MKYLPRETLELEIIESLKLSEILKGIDAKWDTSPEGIQFWREPAKDGYYIELLEKMEHYLARCEASEEDKEEKEPDDDILL